MGYRGARDGLAGREADVGLVLEAAEAAGPWRWRWRLRDEDGGGTLASHQVELDPASDEVARFRDLYGYARWHAAPDRRTADEARIVAEAGAWAGRVLLGEAVGAAIAAAAPVTVRVAVPGAGLAGSGLAGPELAGPELAVLGWPLELAHVGGAALAARGDVSLVYDVAPDGGHRVKAEVAGALRVLAVFSQPTEGSVLALRRERYELGRLIRRIAARQRRRVELRVVQYGVTRQRLRDIADSRDGWDVLHLSGHGGRGLFLLEHADGSPDPVETADLVALLRPVRPRVRLAVVSACQSAADTTAETLRLVGLTEQAEQVQQAAEAEEGAEAGEGAETEEGAEAGAGRRGAAGLARTLVAELDCAVVGMRYPVSDDFAIAFADRFYEHLLGREQPVDVAAARAVAEAASPEAGWP